MAKADNLWTMSARKALAMSVLLGSIVTSYFGMGIWQQRTSVSLPTSSDVVGAGEAVNPFASANGMHLIAFVVTASSCGWSTLPATMEAIGRIREELQLAHGDSYAQVSVVGVALDGDLDAGLQFLADLGKGKPSKAFDQVSVGGSWLNEQVVRFVWREGLAPNRTPQVILIERPVNTESYLSSATIEVQSDRLVVNPIGSVEMLDWIDQGVPLDYSPFETTAGQYRDGN